MRARDDSGLGIVEPRDGFYEHDPLVLESVSAFFEQAFEPGEGVIVSGKAGDRSGLAHLQAIVDGSTAVIYAKGIDGKYILSNRTFEEVFGLSRQQIIGKTDFDIFPEGDARRFRENDKKVLQTGEPIEVKEVATQADGPHTYVSVKFPLKHLDGSVYAEGGISTDITDRMRSSESSHLLAAIVESSEDAIISKDLNGTITSWNKGAERIFGYTPKEIIGKPVTVLIAPERQNEEPEILARIRRGEHISHYETVRRRKDGSDVEVSLTVSPVKDEKGKIVGASKIAREITERKRLELQPWLIYELATKVNSAATLPEVYDAALDAICRSQNTDRASILLYDVGGVLRFKAWRGLSEEYRQVAGNLLELKPEGFDPQPLCVPDISKAPCAKDILAIFARERIRAAALLPITYERRPLGRFTVYYDASHDFTQQEMRSAQTIVSQVAFAIGRHERTAALREAVVQMEEFSYSLSHDLRAPIRAMSCYAEVLMEDYTGQLDEKAKDYLGRIIQAGKRSDKLIQDTLIYNSVSRREMQLHPVSLEKLTREIIQQDITVRSSHAQISIESPLLPVIGHEFSLMQAISNLLSNAVKFVAPGTTPRVHVRTELRGENVRLWIEDNGIGIKPEYQHRLFGMFERINVNENYEGTGIGLAIVRKAAERMGGTAGVVSDGVNGSKFWIQLPAATSE